MIICMSFGESKETIIDTYKHAPNNINGHIYNFNFDIQLGIG